MDEARARRALTQSLWRIRNVLPDIIEGDTQYIQISESANLWIDIETFESLVGDSTENAEAYTLALQQAIDLYRGDLLEGLYDDWVFAARERLRELYLQALEQLVDYEKSKRQYTQALDYAVELAHVDPYREAAHREVMRLYFALKRPEAALTQFETCRKIFEDELGIDVDQRTRAVAQEIALQAPDSQAPYLPIVVTPASPWSLDTSRPAQLPLIGREEEREAVIHFFEETIQGTGGIVLVEGEAGIGKTRLLKEIMRDADWRGVQSLWGHNQEGDVSTPFASIFEAITSGLTSLRVNQLSQLIDNIWFRVLYPLIPKLEDEFPGLTPAPTLTPKNEHDRLVQAVGKVLAAWGQITPVLLVLEDLHWAYEDDIDLLIALSPFLQKSRILVIGTFRGEDAQIRGSLWDRLGALSRSGVKKHFALVRLSPDAAGELVRRSLGLSEAVPLFEKRLYQETLGNPLFILETLRALHDEGLLTQDAGGDWHTPWDDSTSDYGELPLPQAVERTIATRLTRLTEDERAVLSAAAVLGRDFNFSLLSNTTGMEISQVLTIANHLVRRRFLEEAPNTYRFSHDKIRQVAYEAIPAEKRQILHRRAAKNIQLSLDNQARPADHTELLAHHFLEGSVWEQATLHNRMAGDRAKSLFANREAVLYYSRALDAFDQVPGNVDPNLQIELLLSRESMYAIIGERQHQKEDLVALDQLIEDPDIGTPARQLELALRWTEYWEAISDYPAALHAVQDAVEQAKSASDRKSEHQAHLKWGHMLRQHGEYAQAREHLEIAYQLGLENDDLSAQAVSLNALGVVSFDCGKYDQALDYSSRALEIGQPTGDHVVLSDIHNNLGGVFHYLADFPAAIEHHQIALELRRALGDPRLEASSLYNLSIAYFDSGDAHTARENLLQVCDLGQAIGDRRLEGYGWVFLGLVLEKLSELEDARDAYQQGLELRQEVGLHAMANDPLAGLARVATAEGNHQEALVYAQQVLSWISEHGHEGIGDPLLAYLGAYRAYLEAGETEGGLAALVDAYALLTQFADSISDPERQRAYLHDISPGKPIWDDYHEYIAGHPMLREMVHLPRADAPLGRELMDDELAEVTWTLKSPEDEHVEGKAARRQHRTLRLLEEAKAQGAIPTIKNLANVLEVSDRTIKRDLAVLRDAGHQVETRGSSAA